MVGMTLGDTSTTLWYLTRTLGVSAYIALTLSVMLGMLRPIARLSGERLSWVSDELHQFIALLAWLAAVGHLVALKLDPYIPFTLANLLLPADQPYKPFAVNLGIGAIYTMTLVLLTSWLRRHLSFALWRTLHYLSFVAFALVTAHGWQAGSDTNEPWMHGIYVGAIVAVSFLTLMRLVSAVFRRRVEAVEA